MSVKSKITRKISKIVRSSLRLTGRNATSLPGYIAYKLDKDILSELSKIQSSYLLLVQMVRP